jgi:hypothetical protein
MKGRRKIKAPKESLIVNMQRKLSKRRAFWQRVLDEIDVGIPNRSCMRPNCHAAQQTRIRYKQTCGMQGITQKGLSIKRL